MFFDLQVPTVAALVERPPEKSPKKLAGDAGQMLAPSGLLVRTLGIGRAA